MFCSCKAHENKLESLKEVTMEPETSKAVETPPVEVPVLPVPKAVEEQKPPKPERKKRKKSRKIPKNKNFPKFFKNPYIQFCEFTRPLVCEENKDMDPVEVTKSVAAKWYALSAKEKEPFEQQAVQDKERFNKELIEYNIAHPDEPLLAKKRSKVKGSKLTDSKSMTEAVTKPFEQTNGQIPIPKEVEPPKAFIPGTNCELPIFTEQFLDHNKQIESELKLLRKNCSEIEQQNAVLFKHVENMSNGLQKVNGETDITRQRNTELEIYLTRLKVILAAGFHSLTEPALQSVATVENINEYMAGMQGLKTSSATGASPTLINKAEKALRAMDLKFNVELRNFQH